jgi:DNA primase
MKLELLPDDVIFVEGLFDYAVLWQAGFRNVTCAMGTHLNAHQFRQLLSCNTQIPKREIGRPD